MNLKTPKNSWRFYFCPKLTTLKAEIYEVINMLTTQKTQAFQEHQRLTALLPQTFTAL